MVNGVSHWVIVAIILSETTRLCRFHQFEFMTAAARDNERNFYRTEIQIVLNLSQSQLIKLLILATVPDELIPKKVQFFQPLILDEDLSGRLR